MDALEKFFNTFIFKGLEGFGKYYSIYRGFVVSNNDPDNMGKLEVIVPLVKGFKPLVNKAVPFNQFSGKNYGLYNIPLKGDMVWIQFEAGDIRLPIWSNGHFNKGEIPEEFSSTNVRGFKTPSGHLITLTDEGNILIKHKDGKSFEIKDTDITINGGQKGGIPISSSVSGRLNLIEQDINTLKTLFSSWVVVPSDGGGALKTLTTTWATQSLDITGTDDLANNEVLQ